MAAVCLNSNCILFRGRREGEEKEKIGRGRIGKGCTKKTCNYSVSHKAFNIIISEGKRGERKGEEEEREKGRGPEERNNLKLCLVAFMALSACASKRRQTITTAFFFLCQHRHNTASTVYPKQAVRQQRPQVRKHH